MIVVLATLWISGQAPPPPPARPPTPVAATKVDASEDVFEEGVVAFQDGNHRRAAERLWQYLRGSEQTADHYEWAEFYLGRALVAQGLSHAGVEYLYNVAKERRRPELLPQALTELENVRNRGVYDEELIDSDLLAGTDFGALPSANKSFVEYQQGRLDVLSGNDRWASRHFDRLQRSGDDGDRVRRYAARASLATALAELGQTHDASTAAQRDRRAAAAKSLAALADNQDLDAATRNEAARVTAQLLFEQKRFDEALLAYEKITVAFLSEEEANLFLEKAWARYYNGDPRGALGILLSLDAPSYRKSFKPERFVLKALAYKQLCHYANAKASAREFLRRYGSSLVELRRSRDPLTDPSVRAAAVQRKRVRKLFDFLALLQHEREQVESLSDEFGLAKHLGRVYDLKVAEQNRRLERVVREEATAVASELLDYEEQARLIDYEVSLEVFRRLKQGQGKRAVDADPPVRADSHEVRYAFEGEYWNDELHDYRFRIEDRCFGQDLFVGGDDPNPRASPTPQVAK
jgi:hypothetical protein